jgi:hypothetical protein
LSSIAVAAICRSGTCRPLRRKQCTASARLECRSRSIGDGSLGFLVGKSARHLLPSLNGLGQYGSSVPLATTSSSPSTPPSSAMRSRSCLRTLSGPGWGAFFAPVLHVRCLFCFAISLLSGDMLVDFCDGHFLTFVPSVYRAARRSSTSPALVCRRWMTSLLPRPLAAAAWGVLRSPWTSLTATSF